MIGTALFLDPSGAGAATTSLPPPIPTVTFGPSAPVTVTTTTDPPVTTATAGLSDPPDLTDPDRPAADGSRDRDPPPALTGVAGLALLLAAAATGLTWRRRRPPVSAREQGRP